jgi:putative methionine-R-sulfoxide reductase with GAF domain
MVTAIRVTDRAKRLVQAAEIWLPAGDMLNFGSGVYGRHMQFADLSPRMRFHYGEGLPGAVWANGRALVWKDLRLYFVRAKLAAAAGIEVALGCPIFQGDTLMAVLTVLLGRHSESPACVEVWDCDDDAGVLRHGRSHYVQCPEFERFSKLIQFPRGTGLPGHTWTSGEAQVTEDVRQSSSFIRAGLAARCGLVHGLGLPIYQGRHVTQVLALFDAERGSLLRGADVYRARAEGLQLDHSCNWQGGSSKPSATVALASLRAAEAASSSGRPALSEQLGSQGDNESPEDEEITLALPVHDGSVLRQVVCLRL